MNKKQQNNLAVAVFSYFVLLTVTLVTYIHYSTGLIGLATLAPIFLYFSGAFLHLPPSRPFCLACMMLSTISYFALVGVGIPYGVSYFLLVGAGAYVYISLIGDEDETT